jgi:hypothetical protein
MHSKNKTKKAGASQRQELKTQLIPRPRNKHRKPPKEAHQKPHQPRPVCAHAQPRAQLHRERGVERGAAPRAEGGELDGAFRLLSCLSPFD